MISRIIKGEVCVVHNINRGLDISRYHAKPNAIIVYYVLKIKKRETTQMRTETFHANLIHTTFCF